MHTLGQGFDYALHGHFDSIACMAKAGRAMNSKVHECASASGCTCNWRQSVRSRRVKSNVCCVYEIDVHLLYTCSNCPRCSVASFSFGRTLARTDDRRRREAERTRLRRRSRATRARRGLRARGCVALHTQRATISLFLVVTLRSSSSGIGLVVCAAGERRVEAARELITIAVRETMRVGRDDALVAAARGRATWCQRAVGEEWERQAAALGIVSGVEVGVARRHFREGGRAQRRDGDRC